MSERKIATLPIADWRKSGENEILIAEVIS